MPNNINFQSNVSFSSLQYQKTPEALTGYSNCPAADPRPAPSSKSSLHSGGGRRAPVSPPSSSHPQSFTPRAEVAHRTRTPDWCGLFRPSLPNSRVTGQWVSGQFCGFKSRRVSIIGCQPEELQQLLVVRVNEVGRLLPAVVLQLRVGPQWEEVAGRKHNVTLLSKSRSIPAGLPHCWTRCEFLPYFSVTKVSAVQECSRFSSFSYLCGAGGLRSPCACWYVLSNV